MYDDLMHELRALGVSPPKPRITITQILMLRRRGMSDHEIGQRLGVLAGEVRRRRRAALVEDYKAGMAVADLLIRHGVAKWHLYQYLKETNTPLRGSCLTDEELVDLYQRQGRFPGHGGQRYARLRRTDLPLVSEEVEPPPRDELEDALEHWGGLGTAQEYHVTVRHVQRWMNHYGIEADHDDDTGDR